MNTPASIVGPTALRQIPLQTAPSREDVVTRVRSEYREMPGLCLTFSQAQRLWRLDEDTCAIVLSALVEEGYLKVSASGYLKV